MNNLNSATLVSIDQQLREIIDRVIEIDSYLSSHRPAGLSAPFYEQITGLSEALNAYRKQINAMEGEWRSLRALAQIGQVVNSTLELDEVLQIVMDTIIRLTGAERGFLMLRGDSGEMETRVARNWEHESIDATEFAVSRTVMDRVAQEGQPVLTTNAQEDTRFSGQQSVVAYNLRSILCVPLKLKAELIGLIYADNRIKSGLFTQRHLDMLAAFGNQAAVAIENARLFASVRHTLAEVTELKNLMDNVFASIASGVLTTDVEERIMLSNRSAEEILGRVSQDMAGRPLSEILSSLAELLQPHVTQVLAEDRTVTGLEISHTLPAKGALDLRLSLSPLKDGQHKTQGVAIVMEDLTEKKQLEAQRRLFERMVSPAVIEHLNPNSLQLGGNRTEITTLFADIRGFTRFSEELSPEELVSVLNRYLAASADAVLNETGTIDKFLGDAIMAWFNAPIPQSDHTLRAVRAALGIRTAVNELHEKLPEAFHLGFGAGIHVGDAVLGLIGTDKRSDYTAIGDSINTAKRIQENAALGQILISQQAYLRVVDQVLAIPVEPIIAKGKREPIAAYEIIGLK